MTDYLPLLLSWVFFGFVHSLLADNRVKNAPVVNRGLVKRYCRLFYNVVALLTFLPVLFALRMAPSQSVSTWHGSFWIGGAVIAGGVILGMVALRGYDLAEFSGWPAQQPIENLGAFRQSGLLRYVRHPLYLAIIFVLIGLLVYQPDWKHLLFGLAAFLYIRIGIHYEEKKLIETFGDTYQRFRQRTPMIIPSFRKSG